MLMNESRRDYKGRREKRGINLGEMPWRREGGLCRVTLSAIAGVCEECCESGGCARLHARSCLSSCILAFPLHPSAACLPACRGLTLGGYLSLLEEAIEWLPSTDSKNIG